MTNRLFTLRPGQSVRALAHALEDFLVCDEKMRCHVLKDPAGDYIVQARDPHAEITQWAGLSRVLTIRLSPRRKNRAQITIEQGKKEKKMLVLAVGVFLLWGVALTCLCGLLRQRLLIKKTEAFLHAYLNN